MIRIIYLAFFLFLLSPLTTLGATTCSLPCQYNTANWELRVKEINPNPKPSDSSSLWFQLKSLDSPKNDVMIDGFTESPILKLKMPLFNTVTLDTIPHDEVFIFQEWYEKTNAENFEIVLTWHEQDQLLRESIIVNVQ